ncbi:unnamed protein product [Closterium sp. NIES-54]
MTSCTSSSSLSGSGGAGGAAPPPLPLPPPPAAPAPPPRESSSSSTSLVNSPLGSCSRMAAAASFSERRSRVRIPVYALRASQCGGVSEVHCCDSPSASVTRAPSASASPPPFIGGALLFAPSAPGECAARLYKSPLAKLFRFASSQFLFLRHDAVVNVLEAQGDEVDELLRITDGVGNTEFKDVDAVFGMRSFDLLVRLVRHHEVEQNVTCLGVATERDARPAPSGLEHNDSLRACVQASVICHGDIGHGGGGDGVGYVTLGAHHVLPTATVQVPRVVAPVVVTCEQRQLWSNDAWCVNL